MRIIAGKYKRKTLTTTPGTDITRPTSDRTKESIFNILAPYLEGSTILDLFAGSGALGLESLSRGAEFCLFVESHKQALQALRTNITNLSLTNKHFFIYDNSVEEYLKASKKHLPNKPPYFSYTFDVIFADPPYNSPWYDNSIVELENSRACKPTCLFVVEMHKERVHNPQIKNWEMLDERIYGSTKIQIWQRTEGVNNEKIVDEVPKY